jgi:hypothetical protein
MLEDISLYAFGKRIHALVWQTCVYGLASHVARCFRFEGLEGDVTPWIAYDSERRPQDKWCG